MTMASYYMTGGEFFGNGQRTANQTAPSVATATQAGLVPSSW